MNNLLQQLVVYYTHKMTKLDKKIKFYELNASKDNKEVIEKHRKKIAVLKSKVAELNKKLSIQTTDRIDGLNKKLETEKDETVKKHLIKTIDILSAKTQLSNEEQHLISLSHLTMKFGGLKAVDDLSFTVNKGEIFGLIGPNGAGKTTVFNCITQFYKATEGSVYYTDPHGDVHDLNDFKVHNIIDLGIARTFQNVELVWELSVLDNLLVGAHSLYTAGFFSQLFHLPKLRKEEALLKQKATDILESLGLTAYIHVIPYGLPYGILKKIELARVLMTNPKLIILDEPAAGLNDSETKELAKTILDIKQKYALTIILVEHDMELVMDICDRICAMSFGQKLAVGTPKEIQSNKQVQTAYLGGE